MNDLYKLHMSKYNLWLTIARFFRSFGYRVSFLPYWSAKYVMMARLKRSNSLILSKKKRKKRRYIYLSHRRKPLSSIVGIVCCGFIYDLILVSILMISSNDIRILKNTFKNSGFKCSPFIKLTCLKFISMSRAAAVNATARHGGLPGSW